MSKYGQFYPNFTYYEQIFIDFNTLIHKNHPIFWIFQKKYRILHLVKKSKCKLKRFNLAKDV